MREPSQIRARVPPYRGPLAAARAAAGATKVLPLGEHADVDGHELALPADFLQVADRGRVADVVRRHAALDELDGIVPTTAAGRLLLQGVGGLLIVQSRGQEQCVQPR